MKYRWESSVVVLNNLALKDNNFFTEVPQAKEHLQNFIDCVNEVHKETEDSRNLLEEETIRGCAAAHRYSVMKKNFQIDMESAVRNAKADSRVKLRKLQRRDREQRVQGNMLRKKERRMKEEHEQVSILAADIRAKKDELVEIINHLVKKKAQASVNVIDTRIKAAEANENAIEIIDRMKVKQKMHIQTMRLLRREIKIISVKAGDWNEKVLEKDREVTEQRESVDLVQEENKKALARNKGTQQELNERTVNVATIRTKTMKFHRKSDRFLKALLTEKSSIRQINGKMRKTKADFEEKINKVVEATEANTKEAKLAKEIQVTFKIELKKLEVQRDRARKKLESLRSQAKNQQSLIESLHEKLKGTTGDLGTTRLFRMMAKEKLMHIADTRQAMEGHYARIYKVYKEEYEREKVQRKAIQKELKDAEDRLQKIFIEILGMQKYNRDQETETAEIWETLEKKEERLMKELTVLEASIKEKRSLLMHEEETLEVKKQEFADELQDMEERMTALHSNIEKLKDDDERRSEVCEKLYKSCNEENENKKLLISKYSKVLQQQKTIKHDVKNATLQLQELQKDQQLEIQKIKTVQSSAVNKIRQNSNDLLRKNAEIGDLIRQINTTQQASEAMTKECSYIKEKTEGLGQEFQAGIEELLKLERFRLHLQETWRLSADFVSGLNEKQRVETERHLKKLNLLKEHFSDRVFKIHSASSDIDQNLTSFSERFSGNNQETYSSLHGLRKKVHQKRKSNLAY